MVFRNGGISKERSTNDTVLTRTGIAMGSVELHGPEQSEVAPVDARTDVYALGCVLFHEVVGAQERHGRRQGVHDRAPAPSSIEPRVPRTLDAVLARALAKAPDDRQPSAGQLARDAQAAVAAE